MPTPLVTVVCLCYNQSQFVVEALESVLNQTYKNIQLIVVDDASSDNSVGVINSLLVNYPAVEFIALEYNHGNCKAFNIGFARATGEFVIDLAADDVFKPDKIEKQVRLFTELGNAYGVVFTDASYINEQGTFIRNHFEYLFAKGLLDRIPQGDVFSTVIERYFIPSPTMMVRKSILDQLQGYDENLSYEDFDFWVRSSRICLYGFLDERLALIRKSRASMSRGWYKVGDAQVHSTYLVCRKIASMIKNEEERKSLLNRLRYELKQCAFSHNRTEASLFFSMLEELKNVRVADSVMVWISKSRIPVSWIRTLYHTFRYS